MKGYDAAHRDAAFRMRTDRRTVRVHGRDPVRMVQGLVSNDITVAGPTRAVYAAVLTPKGKMVCDVRVLRTGDELLLETDAAAADDLIAHLKKFVPPLFARFEPADERVGVLGVYGPAARERLGRVLATELPRAMAEDDAHATTFEDHDVACVATSYVMHGGFDVFAAPDVLRDVAARIEADGAVALDEDALEVLRVEAGRPRWGAELDGTTIPLEAHLRERAISETKGCYTGQEVIVRILHRGHVNWLLRGIDLDAIEPPPRDTSLLRSDDAKRIGRITSAVRSPMMQRTIALGYVRREVTPPAEVHLETATGPRVRIIELPFNVP